MTKLVKFIASLLSILIDIVLLCVIIFSFVIHTAKVQTYIAQRATSFLSKELNTNFHVDHVFVVFLDRVALKGVYIEDQNKEVLAKIQTILVNVDALDLARQIITIEDVTLEKGKVHLQRDKVNGDYNYQFLADYFSGGSKTKEQDPLNLRLQKLRLEQIDFKYDDHRKTYSEFGMDWDHLDFKNIHLDARNIEFLDNTITLNIKSLSTKEKCGFILKKFHTQAKVDEKGIHLRKFGFATNLSKVYFSKLDMNMNGLHQIYTFEDSVSFDAVLYPSQISMLDVSYFGTALEGMDQTVYFQGVIKEKVNNLKISNFELKTGRKTKLTGTFQLPDFNKLEDATFSERLNYAYVDLKDLQQIKLPKDNGGGSLQLDEIVNRFGFFETKDLKFDGNYSQFVISSREIHTDLGSATIGNGILFTKNAPNDSYFFEKAASETKDVTLQAFDLKRLLNDETFGQVDGKFLLSGEVFGTGEIAFNEIQGDINRFDLLGYSYQNITIEDATLKGTIFDGKVKVADDNLKMIYLGSIDYGTKEHLKFQLTLNEADFENLGLSEGNIALLNSELQVNLNGLNPQKINGKINLEKLTYAENGKTFTLPKLDLKIDRGEYIDKLEIFSEVADFKFNGKIDFNEIGTVVENQLSAVLPALFSPKKKKKNSFANHFTYDIKIRDIKEILGVVSPDLEIAPGTHLYGHYDERNQEFKLQLDSDLLIYQENVAENLLMRQSLIDNNLSLNLTATNFRLNDSIKVKSFSLNSSGTKDVFQTTANWNPKELNESLISWETQLLSLDEYIFNIHPSFVTLKGNRWDVKNDAKIELREGIVLVDHFMFEKDRQYISIDGKVSKNDDDKMRVKVSHFNLEDLGAFLPTFDGIKGEVNGYASISNPFENFAYSGDASVKELQINGEEIGNVFVQSNWAKGQEKIELNGDLVYRKIETFSFKGDYFMDREDDNLDFKLIFDNTDISFTNAFMDPQVIGNIQGRLSGEVLVQGSPEKPKLSGKVDLIGANAYIGILGVNLKTNGKIKVDEYGIYMDNIPITDEDGNSGSVVGSVYHNNFEDWNFDLSFNLEDDIFQKDPLFRWQPKALNRFLILNTKYNENEAYYGRGYVTGFANINGYADNLFISGDLKTEKGSQIFFPMYGVSEIDDEESFVKFLNKDTTVQLNAEKLDFTGVDLDLNFNVTPDAKLKIIFDEKLGDEITAEGSGNIALDVNNLGDIALNGAFTVKNGVYNFALGPVKQNFYIQEGGYISWTGDPYNANLNISSFYKVQANLAEISADQLTKEGTSNQEIFCYLDITESLMRPSIKFNIEAPKASESGKTLLNRIKSDPDELNRQFFSLLLSKRFQPLQGSNVAGNGALLDMASSQINAMLAQLSDSYKLAVNLDADALTGDKSFELGVSKEFLDNRLIFSGSFGVEQSLTSAGSTAQNFPIGEMNLEYLLNETGTFRVNIFNESNQNRILQDNSTGLFKQGVGLHYQEDYNKFRDFKMIQYFFDVFRKKGKKKYPIKRKRQQTPVPPFLKEEE